MRIKVVRKWKKETYTIGKLYLFIDNKWVYFCATLEDKVRITNGNCDDKVYGKTAIPEGEYKYSMYLWAKHNKYYPLLQDVPCFTGIFVHSGATDEDSLGCILVGKNTSIGRLSDGLATMDKLREILLENNEDNTITIE